MCNKQQVIMVDKFDHELGTMDKIEAHKQGTLHRAISVFIFNPEGEWLLQKRSNNKYHSGGLWSNTCCTHPYPGESIEQAAHRRLQEEMGMVNIKLQKLYSFVYQASLDHELTEYELDHVFIGISDLMPQINCDEVAEYSYYTNEILLKLLKQNPNTFTAWFGMCVKRVMLESACRHMLTHQ